MTRVLGILLTIAVSGACFQQPELVKGSHLVVLQGATLIDGTGRRPISNAAVVISGDKILRVGRVGEFRYPDDASIQNLHGRYLVPGFIDVHVHPRVGAERQTLRMLLAFGITTIRIPGIGFDAPEKLGVELRERVAAGDIVGPRIFTGGPIVEGKGGAFPTMIELASQADMRAEVRRQAALGVDLIKLYWSTPKELIRAAVNEAHSLGIQVVGHLHEASWTDAAAIGIDGLSHSAGEGPTWELASKAEQPTLRALPYGQRYTRLQETINLDSPAFDTLVNALVLNRVMVDPTLVTMQALAFGDDLNVLKELEPQLAPKEVVATWGNGWEKGNPFVFSNPWGRKMELLQSRTLFPTALQMVKRFHERGVLLATGTDVGMPWINPGVSYHRELQLLVEAGIPPLDVLSIGTRNGAVGLKASARLGTVAPSMFADVVVLRANPIQDIRNTRLIDAIYKAGRLFIPDSLMATAR